MSAKEFKITVGDTLDPLGVQLKQKNASGVLTAVDLTGSTLEFKMEDNDGAVVILETATGVTILVAATGFAQFQFSDSQVADAGVYWGYFVQHKGGKTRTFPQGRELKIRMLEKRAV